MKMKFHSGVSLIIAIIFVSVLMLLTANLAQVNLAAIKNRANKTLSDRAKDLADSALEMAYYFADKKGVGHNATLEDAKKDTGTNFQKTWDEYIDFFLKPLGLDECTDCIGFRIIGRSEDSAKLKIGGTGSEYFSAPAAYKDENSVTVGTGNAAEKCKDPTGTDADDPCHWNRIYLNEVVEIPLYYVDDNGQTQKLGETDNFKLRVRAPCKNYKDGNNNCAANDRIELYPKLVLFENVYKISSKPFGDPKKDKVLVQWLISDLDTGETLFARDFLNKIVQPVNKRPFPSNNADVNDPNFIGNNTEISGGRINDANENSLPLNNFIMFEQNYWGMDLGKEKKEIRKFIENFTKPTLRLNLVGQPRKLPENYNILKQPDLDPNDTDLFVPYLEYQFLSKDKPIADNKITLFGWAEISDFYKEFKTEKYLPKTEGGFVLGNL